VHEFLIVLGTPRNLQPHYDVAPTDTVDVILSKDGQRELLPMRWGLIPFWRKETPRKMPATSNACAEAVAETPMFRSAFKEHRCIVPALARSGFRGPVG